MELNSLGNSSAVCEIYGVEDKKKKKQSYLYLLNTAVCT